MSLALDDFDAGVMPVGEYVTLNTGIVYWFVAQVKGIWMGAISRRSGLPKKFKFIPSIGIPESISGDDWSALIVFSLEQGQNTGLNSLNVVLQAGGNFQGSQIASLGQDFNATAGERGQSITRLLELATPIGGSTSFFRSGAILSGGADVTGSLACLAGDTISIDWSITDDTPGTSPHLSSIQIKDGNTSMILYALGGGNSSGSKSVRVSASGNVTVDMHNGDTVTHTFMVNIYRAIA